MRNVGKTEWTILEAIRSGGKHNPMQRANVLKKTQSLGKVIGTIDYHLKHLTLDGFLWKPFHGYFALTPDGLLAIERVRHIHG